MKILKFISKAINWWMNLFPYADKVAHVILGLSITGTAIFFGTERWTAFGYGMVGGLAKEMGYDYLLKGHISWLDWFATILGSLIAIILWQK